MFRKSVSHRWCLNSVCIARGEPRLIRLIILGICSQICRGRKWMWRIQRTRCLLSGSVGSTTAADLARRDKPLTISLTLSSILQKQPSGESSLEGCFHLECLQLIYHAIFNFIINRKMIKLILTNDENGDILYHR